MELTSYSAPENEITPTTKKPYTLPAVTFPDGTWIQDSKKIAVEIEKQHPQPSANLESPYQARIEDLLPKFFGHLMPILFNQVPKNLLNEPGVTYWIQDRGSRVGTFDLEAYEKEHGGEAAYEKAKPALDEITDMLKEKEGPFFEGKAVSYADFVWLGVLLCLKRVNHKDYEGAIGKSKDRSVHDGLIEACAEWTKRNDH